VAGGNQKSAKSPLERHLRNWTASPPSRRLRQTMVIALIKPEANKTSRFISLLKVSFTPFQIFLIDRQYLQFIPTNK
jgi:hypothetical protein